jgi:hypothetical protein
VKTAKKKTKEAPEFDPRFVPVGDTFARDQAVSRGTRRDLARVPSRRFGET